MPFFSPHKIKAFFLFCLKSENVFSWSLTKWRPPWLSIAWLTRGRENQLLSLKLLQCCSVTRTKCIRTNLKCLFLAALQYFTSVSSHWVYIRCMNSIFCQCYFFVNETWKCLTVLYIPSVTLRKWLKDTAVTWWLVECKAITYAVYNI